MVKIKIIFITVFTFLSVLLNAQNISSALGCVKTNFQFFSDTIDLEVTSQFILKNAGIFIKSEKSISTGETWGYGGGYESYHLEFITNKNVLKKVNKRANYKYEIKFVDSNGIILAAKNFGSDKVSHFSNHDIEGAPNFYAFDLINIPISVLDETRKIYITEITPN